MLEPHAFHDALVSVVQRPGRVSDGRHHLSFGELGSAVADVERTLADRDLAPRDPVVLECPVTLPGALTLLALLARGTTVVLVPPPTTAALPLPRFARHRIRVLTAEGDLDPAAFLAVDPVPEHRPLPSDAPLREPHLVLRTSGSVARPKLVVHSHRGLLANAINVIERLRLQPSDRVLIPVPLAHMYGLGAAFLPALVAGARIELLDGANLLRVLERERSVLPTVAFFTPNLCLTLLRPRASAQSYRHVVVAGDALDPAAFTKAETIFRRVLNLYGSTELGAICAADADEGDDPHDPSGVPRAATVGRPLPGVELRQTGALGADGKGELLCAHPHGLCGYVDELGEPMDGPSDRWFPTRDLARLHPGGLVEVLGRIDHAVKRDGRLVMLVEIEQALAQLPGVERAAVVVAGHTPRGRGIAAFCSPREGAELDSDRLRRLCHERLPPYAIPDQFHSTPELPLLPSGKLDRVALSQTLSSRAAR